MEFVKYNNRKLYSSTLNRYVNLKEVAGFIKEGHDIKVIKYDTGKDITNKTLASIVSIVSNNKNDLLNLIGGSDEN